MSEAREREVAQEFIGIGEGDIDGLTDSIFVTETYIDYGLLFSLCLLQTP